MPHPLPDSHFSAETVLGPLKGLLIPLIGAPDSRTPNSEGPPDSHQPEPLSWFEVTQPAAHQKRDTHYNSTEQYAS